MKKVSVQLVDDLDGTTADRTVTFALEGSQYEVDLSAANAERLEEALAPYIEKARVLRKSRSRKQNPAAGRAAEIRDWATANGYKVSPRGRIPAEIVEAYDNAN
ncbi:MAG: hypothetical protein CSA63_00620 [Propionibacterium sp.]|nr:MAG: hypothetical protein CSA63_00620 [Propionibacterium sp.]